MMEGITGFEDNPYVVVWSKLVSIELMPSDQGGYLKALPRSTWDTPMRRNRCCIIIR